MATAVDNVFGVPELLEAVLLQLPPQDLLLAQRISRSFRILIKNSIRIRRALFLEHQAPPTTGTSPSAPTLNPFIRVVLKYHCRGDFSYYRYLYHRHPPARLTTLPQLICPTNPQESTICPHIHVHVFGPNGFRDRVELATGARFGEGQSWERMVLSDQPRPVYETDFSDDGPREVKASTLGELAQKFEELAEELAFADIPEEGAHEDAPYWHGRM